MIQNEGVQFLVNGFVASKTLDPAVDFQYGEIHMQCSAEKAVEIGMMLIECAEAAMSDAFLVKFFMEKTGNTFDQGMATVLDEFRQFRNDQKYKESQP